MAVRTPNTREEQDRAYSPEELRNAETVSPDNTANDPTNADTNSVDAVREGEQAAGRAPDHQISYFGEPGRKKKVNWKAFAKKTLPTGLILATVFGGGGAFLFFGSGGLLLVQMKEIYSDFFNDRLAVLDSRVTQIVSTDLEESTTGVCHSKLTIRCKMNTMSKKRFETKMKPELESRGYTVESSNTLNPTRSRITKIIAPDGTEITAQNYKRTFQADPHFRSAMLHGLYNPKFASYADHISAKSFGKMGWSKRKNINAQGDADLREQLAKNASGVGIAEIEAGVESRQTDCTGGEGCENGKRTEYIDVATGEAISQGEYDSRLGAIEQFATEIEARNALTDTGGSVAKATIKGALTSTAFGLGAIDTGCTGYQLIRSVSFMAKELGALQLARYALSFMNGADVIKAGDSAPEEAEVYGEVLTTANSIGQTATDSYGYKYVAYGDTGGMPSAENIEGEHNAEGQATLSEEAQEEALLADETLKYVNGQAVSSGILGTLTGIAGAASTQAMDDTCHFVKSGWGQTILVSTAVVGAVVAFFSGGVTLGWGTVAQVAASVAIGVAITLLTPKLVDMAAGTMIDGSENGPQAGNAITSGMGKVNDMTAQTAAVPVLNPEDAVVYQELTEEVVASNAAVERLEASPFDATNPHTFMGKIALHITPIFSKVSNVSTFFSSTANFITSAFTSLLPGVKAATQERIEQFKVCKDIDYAEMKVAADPFCNLRHGLDRETLEIEPNVVLDYMLSNNYVDEVTGEPTDPENDYAKYLEDCPDRTVSVGGYTEDNPDKGGKCILGHHSGDEEYKYNMFRLYFIDQTIKTTMDDGYAGE